MIKKVLLLILCLNLGCLSNSQKNINDQVQSEKFYTLDIPKLLDKWQEAPISNFVKTVEYISLETSPKSVLGRIIDAKFTDDYIFIMHDAGPIAQFDKSGKFLRNIGSIGRGPGEYNWFGTFSIDNINKLIYIQPNYRRNLLVFSFEGNYLWSIDLGIYARSIVWCRDSLFMCFNEPKIGDEKYVFTETNSKGDTLQTVRNYCLWLDKPEFMFSMTFRERNIFYRLNNRLHFKGEYNDTVYTYDNNNKITPKFFIDLKDNKLPDELRPERGLNKKIPPEYYWDCVRESSRFVFIRVATYVFKVDDTGPLNEWYICFDKKNGSWNTTHLENGRLGYLNDLDGGPDFIPEFTNDSLSFHFIRANHLKNHLASDRFLESNPKFPDKKKILLKQFGGLNETDNDILMIAILR